MEISTGEDVSLTLGKSLYFHVILCLFGSVEFVYEVGGAGGAQLPGQGDAPVATRSRSGHSLLIGVATKSSRSKPLMSLTSSLGNIWID